MTFFWKINFGSGIALSISSTSARSLTIALYSETLWITIFSLSVKRSTLESPGFGTLSLSLRLAFRVAWPNANSVGLWLYRDAAVLSDPSRNGLRTGLLTTRVQQHHRKGRGDCSLPLGVLVAAALTWVFVFSSWSPPLLYCWAEWWKPRAGLLTSSTLLFRPQWATRQFSLTADKHSILIIRSRK